MTPFETVALREEAALVIEQLIALPTKQRTCCVMSILEGYTGRGIAKTLDISYQCAVARIAKGKRTVRNRLLRTSGSPWTHRKLHQEPRREVVEPPGLMAPAGAFIVINTGPDSDGRWPCEKRLLPRGHKWRRPSQIGYWEYVTHGEVVVRV